MPHDLLGAVRGGNSNDSADVFQDAEAVGNVFPEKASILVQNDSVGHLGVFGHHREGNSTVANVSVEYTLQATLITDLTIVHSTDALRDGQDLRQLEIGEPVEKCCLDSLNLIVEQLNLVGALIGKIFVQERHVFCLECLLTIPIFEVGVDAAGVNDLV